MSVMLSYTSDPTPARPSASSGWIVVTAFFAFLALV
jgi:hypothetical protein